MSPAINALLLAYVGSIGLMEAVPLTTMMATALAADLSTEAVDAHRGHAHH